MAAVSNVLYCFTHDTSRALGVRLVAVRLSHLAVVSWVREDDAPNRAGLLCGLDLQTAEVATVLDNCDLAGKVDALGLQQVEVVLASIARIHVLGRDIPTNRQAVEDAHLVRELRPGVTL